MALNQEGLFIYRLTPIGNSAGRLRLAKLKLRVLGNPRYNLLKKIRRQFYGPVGGARPSN